MKVKALINCVGLGYNLTEGETGEVSKKVAEKLISFGYVEEAKSKSKSKEKSDE